MKKQYKYSVYEHDFEQYAGRKPTTAEFQNFVFHCGQGLCAQIDWPKIFQQAMESMQDVLLEEVCECGGKAKFLRWDGEIPILECEKCDDTFDADESYWQK